MSKRPFFFFPSAACSESEPGLKFRKVFNWAAAGFKHAPKRWALLGHKALGAVSFSRDEASGLAAKAKGEHELALVSVLAPSREQEM